MDTTENQSENEIADFVENCKEIVRNQESSIIDEIEKKARNKEEHDEFFKESSTTNQCLFDTIDLAAAVDFSDFVEVGKKSLTIAEIADLYIETMRWLIEEAQYEEEEERGQRGIIETEQRYECRNCNAPLTIPPLNWCSVCTIVYPGYSDEEAEKMIRGENDE